MCELTRRQRLMVEFIRTHQEERGYAPTFQDIAAHFGFRSANSVTEHLRLIRLKGYVTSEPRRARSLRLVLPSEDRQGRIMHIPVLGSIPAGFSENLEQETIGRISADAEALGLAPNAQAFALKVSGDSMIGKHILPGDIAVVEHGPKPRQGDVVAALIDGESALKTFMTDERGPFLRSENPRYQDLRPTATLLVQGVLAGLIRNWKASGVALTLSVLVFSLLHPLLSA